MTNIISNWFENSKTKKPISSLPLLLNNWIRTEFELIKDKNTREIKNNARLRMIPTTIQYNIFFFISDRVLMVLIRTWKELTRRTWNYLKRYIIEMELYSRSGSVHPDVPAFQRHVGLRQILTWHIPLSSNREHFRHLMGLMHTGAIYM